MIKRLMVEYNEESGRAIRVIDYKKYRQWCRHHNNNEYDVHMGEPWYGAYDRKRKVRYRQILKSEKWYMQGLIRRLRKQTNEKEKT